MRKIEKKITHAIALKLARQSVEMCSKQGIGISKAILFGSFAKGNSTVDSDIDLLLVSSQFKNNRLDNWKMIAHRRSQTDRN